MTPKNLLLYDVHSMQPIPVIQIITNFDSPLFTQVMIPGKHSCFVGWTREYHGYLMSGQSDKTQDLCVSASRSSEGVRYNVAESQPINSDHAVFAQAFVTDPSSRRVSYTPVLLRETLPCEGRGTCTDSIVRPVRCVVCSKNPTTYRPLMILPVGKF